MPFSDGNENIKRAAGRPVGSSTKVGLNKNETRLVIRQLARRSKNGDDTATDCLALLLIKGTA